MGDVDTSNLETQLNGVQTALNPLLDEQNINWTKVADLIAKILSLSVQIMSRKEAALNEAYAALKPLYKEPDNNKQEITLLNAKIFDLNSQILQQKLPFENLKLRSYNVREGVFLNTQEADERKAALLKFAKHESLKRDPSSAVRAEAKQPLEDYQKWENPWLAHPLKQNQWYNNHQVAALTGAKVPVGEKDLEKTISQSKKGIALSFAYLMVPEPKNPSLNHFVSMHVSADQKEITYLDSNGEKIRPADEEKLKKQFPNAKIVYRDNEGNKISQEAANESPHNILRVQFDGHNCGMYSTEFATLMKEAAGNEEKIQEGIKRIKEADPEKKRLQHENHLGPPPRQKYTVSLEKKPMHKAKL